jgi:hypothetical protein
MQLSYVGNASFEMYANIRDDPRFRPQSLRSKGSQGAGAATATAEEGYKVYGVDEAGGNRISPAKGQIGLGSSQTTLSQQKEDDDLLITLAFSEDEGVAGKSACGFEDPSVMSLTFTKVPDAPLQSAENHKPVPGFDQDAEWEGYTMAHLASTQFISKGRCPMSWYGPSLSLFAHCLISSMYFCANIVMQKQDSISSGPDRMT